MSQGWILSTKSLADTNRVERFCSKFTRRWLWAAIVAEGYSGSIIIMWRHHIGLVTPLDFPRMNLHLVVMPNSRETCLLSIVYNGQRLELQKILWKELSGISNLNLPWILLGDFNEIISPDEHKGGIFIIILAKPICFLISSLQTCLLILVLLDMFFHGAMVN